MFCYVCLFLCSFFFLTFIFMFSMFLKHLGFTYFPPFTSICVLFFLYERFYNFLTLYSSSPSSTVKRDYVIQLSTMKEKKTEASGKNKLALLRTSRLRRGISSLTSPYLQSNVVLARSFSVICGKRDVHFAMNEFACRHLLNRQMLKTFVLLLITVENTTKMSPFSFHTVYSRYSPGLFGTIRSHREGS